MRRPVLVLFFAVFAELALSSQDTARKHASGYMRREAVRRSVAIALSTSRLHEAAAGVSEAPKVALPLVATRTGVAVPPTLPAEAAAGSSPSSLHEARAEVHQAPAVPPATAGGVLPAPAAGPAAVPGAPVSAAPPAVPPAQEGAQPPAAEQLGGSPGALAIPNQGAQIEPTAQLTPGASSSQPGVPLQPAPGVPSADQPAAVAGGSDRSSSASTSSGDTGSPGSSWLWWFFGFVIAMLLLVGIAAVLLGGPEKVLALVRGPTQQQTPAGSALTPSRLADMKPRESVDKGGPVSSAGNPGNSRTFRRSVLERQLEGDAAGSGGG